MAVEQTPAAAASDGPAAVRLQVEALEHRYGGRRGLHPLSFSIEAPAALAVTGANGSGKTTLLRVLAGLLRPERGAHELRVGGRAVPAAQRFQAVGLLSVESALYDELTARENLEFFAAARGLARPRAAAEQGLLRVGLQRRADDRVAAFSAGMKQRLKLAFALQHDPALLLLDEPGSHLDEAGRAVFAQVVDEQAGRGIVVLATNDEREIPTFAQRLQLRGGGLGHPDQGVAQ